MKKLKPEILEEFANKFRADNNLSQTQPIALKSLLQKLNVLTSFRSLSDDFYGISIRSKNGNRFMMINFNRTKGRQHFTICHELYHLFYEENLTPNICSKDTQKEPSEVNANYFASALLMPREGLYKELTKDEIESKEIPLSKIIYLEQYFSVSRQSILIRLKQLKFLSDKLFELYSSLPAKSTARKYGYDTALYEKGGRNLIIGSFGEKAKYLFDKGKISEGHYCELMNQIYHEKS